MVEERISQSVLIDQLQSSLGKDKARAVVLDAVRELGLSSDRYDEQRATRILDVVAAKPGLIGVVGRFARVRLPFLFTQTLDPAPPPPPNASVPSAPVPRTAERVSTPTSPGEVAHAELVGLLASSLGQAKAGDLVAVTADRLGFGQRANYRPEQAQSILAHLAGFPGVVGRVARLASHRLGGRRRPSGAFRAASEAAASQRVTHGDLIDMLAESVPREEAGRMLDDMASRCGMLGRVYDRDQAMRLLDALVATHARYRTDAELVKTRVRVQLISSR